MTSVGCNLTGCIWNEKRLCKCQHITIVDRTCTVFKSDEEHFKLAIRLFDGRVISYPSDMPRYEINTYLTLSSDGTLTPIGTEEHNYYVGVVIPI